MGTYCKPIHTISSGKCSIGINAKHSKCYADANRQLFVDADNFLPSFPSFPILVLFPGTIGYYHASECFRTYSSAQRVRLDFISRLRTTASFSPYRTVYFGTDAGTRLQCARLLCMDHLRPNMLH